VDEGVVPAERLLVGMALVPVPAGFALSLTLGGKSTAAAASVGWSAKVLGALTKPAVVVTAGATIVAGGAYVVTQTPHTPPVRDLTPTAASTARPPSHSPTALQSPSSSSASPTPSKTADPYGTVVDTVDSAPPADTPPGPLPHRPEAGITSSGGRMAVMQHRGENVTLKGQGYVLVRWQIAPAHRSGNVVMPAWTGLKGKLFHVASGGGRRMDDPLAGSPGGYVTGMGGPTIGYAVLPPGTQQMWQNEYYYLDGSVTLTMNEHGCDYGITVFPSSWEAVTKDIRTGPAQGVIRYGLVRDNGKDTAPVPQYVTRATPADPATVPQRSRV
jgi:hypothetical protein